MTYHSEFIPVFDFYAYVLTDKAFRAFYINS